MGAKTGSQPASGELNPPNSSILFVEYIDLGLQTLPKAVVIRADREPAIGFLVKVQTASDLDRPSIAELLTCAF
jgi:hypothetical protein